MNTTTIGTAVTDGITSFWDIFNSNVGSILGVALALIGVYVMVRFMRRTIK